MFNTDNIRLHFVELFVEWNDATDSDSLNFSIKRNNEGSNYSLSYIAFSQKHDASLHFAIYYDN